MAPRNWPELWCCEQNFGYVKVLVWYYNNNIVVGNKNDSPDKKVVSTEDAQRFAEQIGIELYETSAKENINVEEVSGCHGISHVTPSL